MTSLEAALTGVDRLGLDTAPIIYYVEANPRYDAVVRDVFQQIADGRVNAFTSVITLSEVLVQPFARGDSELRARYRDLLIGSEHLTMLSIDPATAELAASVRAHYRLRMPDALQIAASLLAGCQAFLTNDASLSQVAELRVLVLDDFVQ